MTNKVEASSETEKAFVKAVFENDVKKTGELLMSENDLVKNINQCWFHFDSPAVVQAKQNFDMIKTLVQFGADINARSDWWAGSFGVLDGVSLEQANRLMELGAKLDINSASELGLIDEVDRFLQNDPQLVHHRGGDGQTPLHVAGSIEIIDRLVDAGADLEARDVDHYATAAQYLVDQPDLCRHLLSRGATPDIYMATALGDFPLVKQLIEQQPDCVNWRIGLCPHSSRTNDKAHNHIYFWKLKQAQTPAEIAITFDQDEIYEYLYMHSQATTQLVASCWQANPPAAKRVLESDLDVMQLLDQHQQKDLARAAWTGKTQVVQVMLECGFDPHVVGDEESTPLDRASFHGYRDIVELLLQHDTNPPLEQKNVYGGTPLDACTFGALHSWIKDSDHPGTARLLIKAGAKIDPKWIPTGSDEMDEVLEEGLRSS